MQDVEQHIELFTDLEKDKIQAEFDYYTMKRELVVGEKATDPFTEQMLSST